MIAFNKMTNAEKTAHNLKHAQFLQAQVNNKQVVSNYIKSLNGTK